MPEKWANRHVKRKGRNVMAKRKTKKSKLPGSIFLNSDRYWWRVTLPGETKRQAIPLKPRGAKYATKDIGVADEVARQILAKAIFNTKVDAGRDDDGSIVSIVQQYMKYAEKYYRKASGTVTSEPSLIRYALNRLVDFCPAMIAEDFGPLKLKEFQQKLVDDDQLCRNEINRTVKIVRRMFKWAVSEELVPANTLHALQSVEGLKRGRTTARDTEPVRAVPEAHVYAVLPYASEVIADMIQLQLLTGMRSGELTALRAIDIETSGKVWHYCVTENVNKTAHHGGKWVASLGPKAQKIVKKYMQRDLTAFMFSPKEAKQQSIDKRTAKRKIPAAYGNRPGTNRKENPDRSVGDRYDTKSYRKAVLYALAAANRAIRAAAKEKGEKSNLIPHWSPHQLRHTSLTKARKEFGLEASSTFGGHKKMNVTEIYAEKNMALADKVALKLG